jgi:serine/threonine protein kinase
MAKGGMGELFLAAAGETGGFEKLCVVKKVLHDLTDPGVRRRFLDEAKVVVRLNHANLVTVFDAGRVDQEHYLAMELVEGKDLRAVWNRCAQLHRRIPVDFALHVARELARGLSYVHDAMGLNLVHRDISPPNILVGYNGPVKITDFGLAKHAIKREMTSPGVVFGRYSYLSPEQARGLPADRRTDIYAGGIILWEMLTGRQLFPQDGRDASILRKLRKPDIPAPSTIVPGIPEGVDQVVLRALAVERDERYQNAEELREELSALLARHFPRTDVDRVAAFMKEIFAREVKIESQDYGAFAREDFSPVRALARTDTETISVSEAIELELEEIEPLDHDGSNEEERILAAAESRVGITLDERYRLSKLLSCGGMGAVYRAVHQDLGTTYAVKIIHPHYGADPEIISRFRREARAATQTGHPNIVDVIEVGTTPGGDTYSVMELLHGRELRRVIEEEGAMDSARAVNIARQMCNALAAAHEAGIIHRDLKSANIVLIDRAGESDFVKVLDFGICKHFDDESTLKTTPGLVMGSPDYMAPEQAAGAPADVKSDIYAVGTILFEMLTGRLPFEGRNAIDVLMQKGGRRAPSVAEYQAGVNAPLEELVARCLHRSLDERPDSMRELEGALAKAIDGRAEAERELVAARSGNYARSPSTSHPALTSSSSRVSPIATDNFMTVHGQALVSGQHAAVDKAPWWKGGLKALTFVALGVALATGGFYLLSEDDDGREARAAKTDLAAPPLAPSRGDQAPAEAAPAEAAPAEAAPAEEAPADEDGDAELALDGEESGGELVEEGSGGEAEAAAVGLEPAQLAERAQAAFDAKHWREPVAGSLAIELANLGLVDPGNEAISRLRSATAKELAPKARRALKRKKWADAVALYRDLFAVWPEYDEDARDDFVTALRNQGRVLRRVKDHEGALATADELLNVKPDYFTALKLRADSLASLGRWEEAVPAYRAAMRARPSSKDAKKGYWRARGKLKNR